MTATNWRSLAKNTLKGFLDLELPSGLVLRECSLHERDGKKWIGLPGKPQIDRDGKVRKDASGGKALYVNVVGFATKEARERFRAAAIVAARKLLGQEERQDAALFP
jgi:hypothetical protein